jgi:hypothetical protein
MQTRRTKSLELSLIKFDDEILSKLFLFFISWEIRESGLRLCMR